MLGENPANAMFFTSHFSFYYESSGCVSKSMLSRVAKGVKAVVFLQNLCFRMLRKVIFRVRGVLSHENLPFIVRESPCVQCFH